VAGELKKRGPQRRPVSGRKRERYERSMNFKQAIRSEKGLKGSEEGKKGKKGRAWGEKM